MTFSATFNMDNSAFDLPATEAARILRELAEQVEEGQFGGKIMDANGNSCGHWRVS